MRLLVRYFDYCVAFYRDKLGFEVTREIPGTYAELSSGEVTLAIYRRALMAQVIDRFDRRRTAKTQDQMVLCLRVDDVDAACRELEANGVAFETSPHNQEAWYLRVAYFRDPDGNLIEINHPLPEVT